MNIVNVNEELENNIEIVYEDENVVGINKPAGLVVHSDGKTKETTVVDWMLKKYPDIQGVGESLVLQNGTEIARPGIVHRIDRATSGILLIAKNQDAFEYLKKQFQEREIKKIYKAFVYGEMKEDEGEIDRPIGKSKKDFRAWSAQRGARGLMREALTEYKVLKRGGGFSYVEISPKTGRTHQIRVHFKAINYPVVCDSLYALKQPCELGFNRLALHAESIRFTDQAGKEIDVSAPLPEDFKHAIGMLTQ